ncbi:MAG: response regulator [Deltaproteobacteria bacterium]|nr:response regulator [Deltaproteobacteria bacterium]
MAQSLLWVTRAMRERILVVDDEEGPRESLKIILNSHYEVTATERGTHALELLGREHYDVVLLDLTMPHDLSGTDTLRLIRESQIDVEAIVITGQGALDTAVECLRLGARDYIAKPYRSEDVRTAVRSALAVQSARRRATEMREHLLGNLSHEFRTPLHAIVGYSEILHEEADAVLSQDQRRAVARIRLNSERLLSYLEGLFFLAEMDSGDAPATPREFVVRPWLERVLQPICLDADRNGVTVDIQCDTSLIGHTHPETLARLVSALTYAASDQPSGGSIRVLAERTIDGLSIFVDPGRSPLRDSAAHVSLENLELGDPLAQEVIERAAASLDARIVTETDGQAVLRVHILVPSRAESAPAEAQTSGAADAPAEP